MCMASDPARRWREWPLRAGTDAANVRPVRHAPLVQGAYFVLAGVWPLISMRTFEAVTGPKVDRWLVKTVGLLVTVVGSALLADARRPSRGTTTAGIGSAVALGAVDVVYAARGRISTIYLLDAVVEAVLLAVWLRDRRDATSARGR